MDEIHYLEICKCCLEESELKNLWIQNYNDGEKEIYGEILNDCFGLGWERPTEDTKEYICESCSSRLRNANNFKKEILNSAKMLSEHLHKASGEDIPTVEEEDEMEMKTEYLYDSDFGSDNGQHEDIKKETIEITIEKDTKQNKNRYTQEKLHECLQAVLHHNLSQRKASELYNIPRHVIASALATYRKKAVTAKGGEEFETETDIETEYLNFGNDSDVDEREDEKTQQAKSNIVDKIYEPKKGRKKYTQADLEKCLQAVLCKKYTQLRASEVFKVPRNAIGNAMAKIRPKTIKKKPVKPTERRYTEEDLEKCLQAIRSENLTVKKASELYNISRHAIGTALAKAAEEELLSLSYDEDDDDEAPRKPKYLGEIQKRRKNVAVIMKYTNATPFKDRRHSYACYFCNLEYGKPEDLKLHTITEHHNEKQNFLIPSATTLKLDITHLDCELCNKRMDSYDDLLEHFKSQHRKLVFTNVANYVVPFRFEDDELKCSVCSEVFLSFKLLNDHVHSNHYKNHVCGKCGRSFINKRSLMTHSYRHETGTFTCRHCHKEFSTHVKCKDHERNVHVRNKRNKCRYCEDIFSDYVQRNQHELIVHDAELPVHKCKSCPEVYSNQRALQKHVNRVHLNRRPHKCEECNMSFATRMFLRTHMVKHTGAKDFMCDICTKSFGRKTSLRQHLRIHANDRRFRCEYCDQAFIQKCSWRSHLLSRHEVSV